MQLNEFKNKEINDIKNKIEHIPEISIAPLDKKHLPKFVKIIAIICIVQCIFTSPFIYDHIKNFVEFISNGEASSHSTTVIISYIIFILSSIAAVISFLILGIYLNSNKRRNAALLMNITTVTVLIAAFCDVCITGFKIETAILFFLVVLIIVLKSYVDPSLSEERKLQSKLRKLNYKKEYEEGNIGLSKNNKGYAEMNYFNIFWIFVLCSILGYVVEIIWHMTVDNPGVYEERAGLLFGPFSPIYGLGGVIMTLFLNRLTNKNIVIGFIVSALIGGFFEYFASLYLEIGFGVRSWDYSHLPLNIEGRTSIRFFIMWGIFGTCWLKIIFKPLIRFINKIPWKWRYGITIFASILMFTNIIMTTQALDCWYSRANGNISYTPIEQFYSENFNDNFMRHRFENMEITPNTNKKDSNF